MPSDAGTGAAAPGLISPTRLGQVGRTATSWGLAGGLVASVVVTAHVLLGALSSSLGFVTTTIFFVVGSAVGYVHGGVLAYLGRPGAVKPAEAVRRLALTAVYAIPVMLGGWVIGMLLALSAASLLAGRVAALIVSLAGWVATVAALAWALVETRSSVGHVCNRWPIARAVLLMLVPVFAALVAVFVGTRPEIWGVGVTPTPTAAVAMALAATVWIAAPVLVVAFRVVGVLTGRTTSTRSTEVGRGFE